MPDAVISMTISNTMPYCDTTCITLPYHTGLVILIACRIPASLVYCGSRPLSPVRGETGDDCLVLVLQCLVHGAESHAVIVLFPHL